MNEAILIVEDEAKIRDQYTRLLAAEGYKVTAVENVVEATRELIRKRHFDLVLLDINLPDINGCYGSEIFYEYDPDIRIIVASVYPLDKQKLLVPHAADYFDKSQGSEILLEKISGVLVGN